MPEKQRNFDLKDKKRVFGKRGEGAMCCLAGRKKPCRVKIYRKRTSFPQEKATVTEEDPSRDPPKFDLKEKWVQEYMKQNGHEPTFF